MKKTILSLFAVLVIFCGVAAVAPSPAYAAIAFDRVASSTAASISFNNSGNLIIACEYSVADTTSAPSYNGAAFTLIGKTTYPSGSRVGAAMYFLIAPSTGSNTFTPGGTFNNYIVSSWTGVNQTTPKDGSSVAHTSDGNHAVTATVTTSVANSWVIGCEGDSGAGAGPSYTGGTATVVRSYDTNIADSLGDSGPVSAGSNTITINANGAVAPALSGMIAQAFQVAAVATAPPQPPMIMSF